MYTFNKRIAGTDFASAVDRTRQALSGKGFGVLTEIDVQQTMKAKLGADMPPYLILGACNPGMAFEALKLEPGVGAMLPCNVIVREAEDGTVEVSAVDPVASMQAIDNEALLEVAAKVRILLSQAVATL